MISDKRYSIFISSTFKDLRDERRAVQDAVISGRDFPVQMESFPAADEDQFEFIEKLIDTCDFYILIIAGRYGTPASDGISYTEKEYEYALSKDIPILVLLRSNIDGLPMNKSEATDKGKERLRKFRESVENGRLRKEWSTIDELKLRVREALDYSKATKDAIGWVRGDTTAQLEVLEDLNRVQKENATYREQIGQLEVELPPLPDATTPIELKLLSQSNRTASGRIDKGSNATIKTTWINAFPIFYSNLSCNYNDYNEEDYWNMDTETSCLKMGSAIAAEFADFDTGNLFKLSEAALHRLCSYYVEVGLVLEEGGTPFSASAKKLVRRQRIAENQTFTIISGEISLTKGEDPPSSFDDEIPF